MILVLIILVLLVVLILARASGGQGPPRRLNGDALNDYIYEQAVKEARLRRLQRW